MNPTFRVEAFIVPKLNRKDKNDDNIIDDVKVANKWKNTVESPKAIEWMNHEESKEKEEEKEEECDNCATSDEINKNIELYNNNSNTYLPIIKSEFTILEKNKEDNERKKYEEKDKNNVNIDLSCDVIEPIYDVPYSLLNVNKIEPVKLRERFETDEYVTMKMIPKDNIKFGKSLIRTSSLMSIDERGETPDDCNDEFCCHGYKNGCTAITQRPEAVTKEIFEINWMKRLEQLRTRETIIKNKEAVLFDRERLLFKKERELRILERLVKDKLKHAELYLKRCKLKNNDVIDCDVMSKFSEQSKDSQMSKDNETLERLSSIENIELCHKNGNNTIKNKKINSESIIRETSKSNASINTRVSLSSEKILRNPPNSRSSLVINPNEHNQAPKSDTTSSYLTGKNTFTGVSGYSSLRIKKRPKITYDDLDSTLSADIGDSSFVVTSKKFDPEIFKKPYAFTRSCSERRHSKINLELLHPPPKTEIDYGLQQIEEDKLLKRISENILVSHDKNTKFQNYGLIDTAMSQHSSNKNLDNDNKRHSYLDLEDGKKGKKNQLKNINKKINTKERPISWNEETNEWLLKKREAYNLQTAKKILTDDINDKENHGSQLKLSRNQKKISKGIKFNIFR